MKKSEKQSSAVLDRGFALMVGAVFVLIMASHVYTTQYDEAITAIGRDLLLPRKAGIDLPVDAKLRIGALKRVDDASCVMKSTVGDHIAIHYTGWTRTDGIVFDSSVKRGQPFEFIIGKDLSMIGWEEGLLDMCIGAVRRLTVPANKAVYAMTRRPMWGVDAQGTPTLPADATLVFDVEMLNIKRFPNPRLVDPFVGLNLPTQQQQMQNLGVVPGEYVNSAYAPPPTTTTTTTTTTTANVAVDTATDA